jgi:hypothetical protein
LRFLHGIGGRRVVNSNMSYGLPIPIYLTFHLFRISLSKGAGMSPFSLVDTARLRARDQVPVFVADERNPVLPGLLSWLRRIVSR